MSGIELKHRPSRLFYDKKSNEFYVIQNGKKAIVKVPAKFRTNHKAAQAYIIGKLENKMYLKKKAIKKDERVYYQFPSERVIKSRALKQSKTEKQARNLSLIKDTIANNKANKKLAEEIRTYEQQITLGTPGYDAAGLAALQASFKPTNPINEADTDYKAAELALKKEEEAAEAARLQAEQLAETKRIATEAANQSANQNAALALLNQLNAETALQSRAIQDADLRSRQQAIEDAKYRQEVEQKRAQRQLIKEINAEKNELQLEEIKRNTAKQTELFEKIFEDSQAQKQLAIEQNLQTQIMKDSEQLRELQPNMPNPSPMTSLNESIDEVKQRDVPIITEVMPSQSANMLPLNLGRQKINQSARRQILQGFLNLHKMKKTEVPTFEDSWNGPRSNQEVVRTFGYLLGHLNNAPETELLQLVGNYNIKPTDDRQTIKKKVLDYITPLEFNRLIEEGVLKFSPISNPEQLGKGDSENDERSENNPLPPLYNDEIEEYFDDEPQFGGVIASDQILDLPNKLPMGFIMNTDDSKGPGKHWVAVYINGDSVEYFDPLADSPTKETIKDIKEKLLQMKVPNLMKFKVNKIIQQHGNSKHCGFHAIRFLDDRFNGIPFPLSTRYSDEKVNNSKEGENKIREEFKFI